MNDTGRRANGDSSIHGLLPWLAALITGLLSLAAFLLWGLNGADIVLGMAAFYCG